MPQLKKGIIKLETTINIKIMNNKDILSNCLDWNSLSNLSVKELIDLDGGDISQVTQGVLEWCGRNGGHIANAWDYYKKAMIDKANSEHYLF